jgi:hypothetical protein
LYLG